MDPRAGLLQFAEAANARMRGLRSDICEIVIRQQPVAARVAVGKEKDRKPVDPPPIVQLQVDRRIDPNQNFLQSPYYFMTCSLIGTEGGLTPPPNIGASLAGTVVSSLHRLKDAENVDGAFFIFGDLSVKVEGKFRLQFNLYEIYDDCCLHVHYAQSNVFTVHGTKNFPGMGESSPLTRTFSDQGVRLRLRKEPRTLLRKRGPASEDYVPRHYNKPGRNNQGDQSIKGENPQHGQGELQGSMHDMHSSHFEQRPEVGRVYSQQSSESFSPGYSDEPNIKRPRTGSEQNPSQPFGQQHFTPDASQYSERRFSEAQPGGFDSFTQQQQTYQTYGYTQSPQTVTPREVRDHYFPPQAGIPIHRSPHTSDYFSPTQHTFQTPQPFMIPQIPHPAPLEFPGRAPHPPAMIGQGQGISPPDYRRTLTAPGIGTLAHPSMERSHSLDIYQTSPGIPNPNTTSGPILPMSAPPGNFEL